MSNNWYFHYQVAGKHDEWRLGQAGDREKIIRDLHPMFITVLDLSTVPDDHDWSKVRYKGPLYFDFDADGDLPLVCEQFNTFLLKLSVNYDFDLEQAKLFASGGKGFHIEIPQGCFIQKPSPQGYAWLPYVYREMAQALFVDTLDMNVYTGKRGRQWRTPNVKRENDCYKVQLRVDEAMAMTPELYEEIIQAPRVQFEPTPSVCNTKLSLDFDKGRDKVTSALKNRKKKSEKANEILDKWRKANRTPPTIEKLMAGENLREGASFQKIALQLSIYASSVGMELQAFLEACQGLCENHISDGTRYNTFDKRQRELARMWEYMQSDDLYVFEPGPIAALFTYGTPMADLGVVEKQTKEEAEERAQRLADDPEAEALADLHLGVRRGFSMGPQGMFVRKDDSDISICRAFFDKVESFYDAETLEFKGYEFDIVVPGRKTTRAQLSAEAFTSAANMKKFLASQQLSYQGGEPETAALLDVMADRATRGGGRVYTFPREGFFLINNPEIDEPTPVKAFLTKDTFVCSVPDDDPHSFKLRYRPTMVTSSYNIDIHKAPDLDVSMADRLQDLFAFSKPSVVADCLGWFVAAHYRSLYLDLFGQFPMLQIYGEAGAGKSQTVLLLAHLHWYNREISVKSAASCTAFAMDTHASTSTSAPFILDEYKPRELRATKGRLEKIKDVFKASYIGGDIGERGTVNKGADSHLAIIKSKATAPIVFMGEAIEMETAIFERSVSVNFSKSFHTVQREAAFLRLQANPTVLSAIGKQLVELGFRINLEEMRKQVMLIQQDIKSRMPSMDDDRRKPLAKRLIYNRAVVIHALTTLRSVLSMTFGSLFDDTIEALINSRAADDESEMQSGHGMSEVSKVISRIALLSRESDESHYRMCKDKDYLVGGGFVELKVERAYDQYRRYCVTMGETPLFDSLEAFNVALNAYSPVTDKFCAVSALKEDESTERVVRLDLRALIREGVQAFRA